MFDGVTDPCRCGEASSRFAVVIGDDFRVSRFTWCDDCGDPRKAERAGQSAKEESDG